MNKYKKNYYTVCLKNDDNYDSDFTSVKSALDYGKELKRTVQGTVELHTYLGEKGDEHAIYLETQIL